MHATVNVGCQGKCAPVKFTKWFSLLFYCFAILPASFPDGSLAIPRASSPVIRVSRSPLFATKVRNEAPEEEAAILPYKGKKTYEMYQRIALSSQFDRFFAVQWNNKPPIRCFGR